MKHELRQVVAEHKLVVNEDSIRIGSCLVIGDETFVGRIILHNNKRYIYHDHGYGNLQAYLYVYELNNIGG